MRNTNYKYFLYARKSSESEDRQMASIDDQIREVRKLAENYGIEIVDVIEESRSAKEPGRPLFNQMLSRIHKGEADGILTWKLNRLARNPIDGGQISWMLQQNIIKHIQTFERDYNPGDNVLLMQVEFGMANQYVKDLSLDVKRGMRQKAERGWYPIPQLPIGYMHNPRLALGIESEIIPDEKSFSILKKLWQLLLTGDYSIADLRRKGNALGLKNKGNRQYSKTGYYKLFFNEFYAGYYVWPDKDGNLIRHKGKHKAIVSQIEFQKAQIILQGRPTSVCKERKYDFPYRSLIKCGECGCFITPDHKLQTICTNCKCKYSIKTRTDCPKCHTEFKEMKNPSTVDILYYRCSKSKGKCSQKAIIKPEIDAFLEKELKQISISKKILDWSLERLKPDLKDIEEMENNIRGLKRRKTELENRMSQLVAMRADGEINSEQFNSSMLKTQKEISLIELEIDTAEKETLGCESNKNDNYNFALELLEKFKNGDDSVKTEIAREVSSNLTLKDKKLYITMGKSFLEIKNSLVSYTSKN